MEKLNKQLVKKALFISLLALTSLVLGACTLYLVRRAITPTTVISCSDAEKSQCTPIRVYTSQKNWLFRLVIFQLLIIIWLAIVIVKLIYMLEKKVRQVENVVYKTPPPPPYRVV